MKNVLFGTAQRVIKQMLDWLQSSKETSIKEWRQDYLDAGIVIGLLNEFDIIAGTNNTALTPSVTIRTGVAYDSNGERIVVSDEATSYSSSHPSDTTDDGKGNLVLTPHSTGSLNIPLTTNINNYLWIEYLLTTDETAFTLQKITNSKQFYKQVDGYKITVTTTNVAPSGTALKLGNVDLTGSGVVSAGTISKANRVYSRTSLNRVSVKTPLADLSDKTTSYGFNETHDLQDHIKAIGSGTISAANPHGLAPEDIGLSSISAVDTHQKYLHSNGIAAGSKTSVTSSLYGFVTTITPGFDFLTIRPLSPTEQAIVDGETVTSVDLSGDSIISFNSLDASGTWYIYLDKVSKTVLRTQTNLVSNPDSTKFLLYSVVWTYPGGMGAGDGDLSALTDYRAFGNVATREIQDGAVTSVKVTAPLTLADGIASAPTYSFTGDTNTGMYKAGTHVTGFSSNGNSSLQIGDYVSAVREGFATVDGSVSLPSMTFSSAVSTGFYKSGTNQLSFTSNGAGVWSSDSTNGLVPFVDSTYDFGGTSLRWSNAYLIRGQFGDGSVSAPGLTFQSDVNTGVYKPTTSTIGFTTASTLRLSISTTAITSTLQWLGISGSVAAPSLGFSSSTNTGAYLPSAGNFAIAAGGTQAANFSATQQNLYVSGSSKVQIDSTGLTIQSNGLVVASGITMNAGQVLTNDGTSLLPAYSFTNNATMGLYRISNNVLGISVGGAERMRIDTTPQISVTGNINFTGNLFSNGVQGIVNGDIRSNAVDENKIVSTTISTTGALNGGSGTKLSVRTDGSTITINGSNNIGVPNSGIGNSQLANSSVDANKISTSAINGSGALDGGAGTTLNVRVDNSRIGKNGSNQLRLIPGSIDTTFFTVNSTSYGFGNRNGATITAAFPVGINDDQAGGSGTGSISATYEVAVSTDASGARTTPGPRTLLTSDHSSDATTVYWMSVPNQA